MNRAEKRRLKREVENPTRINKNSLEYREGIKEGIRRERGNWVEAMSKTKGIGDLLLERVLGKVADIYRSDLK